MKILSITTTGIFALFASIPFAFGAKQNRVMPPHDTYVGVRALGMGGAFVSVANDESAMFSNPAGIGREDGKESKAWLKGASFPNATAGVNRNPSGIFNAYLNAPAEEEGQPATDKNTELLKQINAEKLTYLRASLFPYFTLGRFQLGYIVDQTMEAYRSDYTTPQESEFSDSSGNKLTYTQKLSIFSRVQSGPTAGFSVQHQRMGLSLGVAARVLSRSTTYGDFESSAATVGESGKKYPKSVNKTSGTAVDAGLLFKFGKNWSPQIGLAARDIGHTTYKTSKADGYNEVDRANVVAGISLNPPLGKRTKWIGMIVSAEGQRLNDSRVQVKDKIRFGTEWSLFGNDSTAPLLLRAGHNLRGFAFGATLDLFLFKMDYSSYVQAVDGAQGLRTDRRHFVRLSVDLRS